MSEHVSPLRVDGSMNSKGLEVSSAPRRPLFMSEVSRPERYRSSVPADHAPQPLSLSGLEGFLSASECLTIVLSALEVKLKREAKGTPVYGDSSC